MKKRTVKIPIPTTLGAGNLYTAMGQAGEKRLDPRKS